MRIITLVQSTTNLVFQFVKIIFKILALYLYDQIKLFLTNMRVKKLKSIYNNEKLTSEIGQYIVEHI